MTQLKCKITVYFTPTDLQSEPIYRFSKFVSEYGTFEHARGIVTDTNIPIDKVKYDWRQKYYVSYNHNEIRKIDGNEKTDPTKFKGVVEIRFHENQIHACDPNILFLEADGTLGAIKDNIQKMHNNSLIPPFDASFDGTVGQSIAYSSTDLEIPF